MINESLKAGDYEKVKELKRSLLNLEKRSSDPVQGGASKKDEEDHISPTASENSSAPQSLDKTSTRDSLKEFTLIHEAGGSPRNEPAEFSPVENRYLEKAIKQNVRQHDLKVCLMLLGGKATGKTTLMHAFLGERNVESPKPTHGLDSKSGIGNVAGKIVRYKIVDSDSDHSKEFIRKVYYDMSQAIVILFDISSKVTFEDAKEWAQSVAHAAKNPLHIFLVGNDLSGPMKRTVSIGIAKKFARENNLHYHEIAAKNGKGVKELLDKITYYVMSEAAAKEIEPPEERGCMKCIVL